MNGGVFRTSTGSKFMHEILETLFLFLILTFPLSNSNQCSHLPNSGRSVLRNKPELILITFKICRGIERIKYLTLSWGLFKLQPEKQHCKNSLLLKPWFFNSFHSWKKQKSGSPWEPSEWLSRFTWKVLCGFLVICCIQHRWISWFWAFLQQFGWKTS